MRGLGKEVFSKTRRDIQRFGRVTLQAPSRHMDEIIVFTNTNPYDAPVLLPQRLPNSRRDAARVRFGFVFIMAGILMAGSALLPVLFSLGAFSRASTAVDNSPTPAVLSGRPLTALPAEPVLSPEAVLPAIVPLSGTGRVIIEKIGVSMPIVEGENEQVLFSGAWRYPFGSMPDQGGNTVLFGHRYKNLPPNPETFFALDKLAVGDQFTVLWGGKTFRYRVVETKVVPPTDISVLDSTGRPTLTLITCTPVFTTKARLVIRSELI
ncbi:MAG: hypothetical protein A2682_00570 [Candidatus Terrybacteria bacterium RIFCSPHIGHO2_01_FULL_58_15]|uniref:Sortase n=2 Tax=Candidatus Terryibacteriota TaxID=1817920 RepID=A0A1G2PKW0_TERXR|nr:MAG: hypothetical protein A2682_00570 [Candidatus Terrybacteria bacterium RIFCSPHIGHO2_01_FULL_58_15]